MQWTEPALGSPDLSQATMKYGRLNNKERHPEESE